MKKRPSEALWQAFGTWIKEQRENRKWTQGEAAAKIGLDRQQWYRIEKGKSGTKRDTVIKIAEAFSLDISDTLARAGFAYEDPGWKPSNMVELMEALEKLGIRMDHVEPFSLSPEDYGKLLDDIRLVVALRSRR